MKGFKEVLLAAAVLGIFVAPGRALDTWSTTKGILNMPLVTYNGKTYHNVTAVLGGVISVGSACSSTSTAADFLSPSTGQLTIPAVTVTSSAGTTTYCNAQVWLSSVTSVGGICASAATCSRYFAPVQFANKMPRSYTPTLSQVTGSFSNRARYLISDSGSTTAAANYLSIGGDFTASGTAGGYAVTSGTIPLSATYGTYLSKLIQVVAVKDDGTNADVFYTDNKANAAGYRLDSHLHPNESIDVDAANGAVLKFRRNVGGPPAGTTFSTTTAMTPITTSDGFVTFNYDAVNHRLQASRRYIRRIVQDVSTSCTKAPCFNASFVVDNAFTLGGYYVNVSNGTYSLAQNVASATPLYFYASFDGYTVPASVNPTGVAASTANPAAAFPTNASGSATAAAVAATETNYAARVFTRYQNQVTAPGADQSTKAAADAFLQTMKTDVEANTGCAITVPAGTLPEDLPTAALRYSPEVYTAFRDALLSGTLVSDAVADGTPSQKLVPFVYFTNEADPANPACLAPMMVIITYGQPGGPHGLQDVPVPPAAGANTANVGMTRYTNLIAQTTRIPLRNYGNVNPGNFKTVNSNVTGFTANLCTDLQSAGRCDVTRADPYNWASSNDNGISYDGAQIFPIMNNTLVPSNWKAELSTYGCHVGQGGGGPHCHADGFVSGQDNKLTLYSDEDYAGRTHPPLVGFGYDGIALFGKYRTQDAAMLGANALLDAFSGHDHDGIGYHYHAREADVPSAPFKYTYTANGKTVCSATDAQCVAGQQYSGGIATPTRVSTLLQGAWKGNIAVVPFFRTASKTLAGQN